MKKVKITKPTAIAGTFVQPGQIAECDNSDADILIAYGKAVPFTEAAKADKPKRSPKITDAPAHEEEAPPEGEEAALAAASGGSGKKKR